MLLSVAFQQIYNIADSVVAGQLINVDALAAVGASYPITLIFIAVASGSNIGCSVVISQLFGAGQYGRMKTAVSTSLISCLVLSGILMGGGLIFCSPLMKLMGTPENIFADSELYLQVYLYGMAFLFLYNVCTGIFTALGDSRTPLYFLIASSVGNIILDVVFVAAFQMGVGGVAWATFLAQGVASVLSFLALRKRLSRIGVQEEENVARFSLPMLGRIAKVAIPSILQQSFVSVGNLFIQGLVNSFGSAVIAGYAAAVKLNNFSVTCFTTLANGLSNFTAQNMGAQKPDRVKKGYRSGLLLALCVVLPFSLLYCLLPQSMIGIFMDLKETDAVAAGIQFLYIVAPFYFVVALKVMTDAVLRGSGCMGSFMITTFSDLILRVVLSFWLAGAMASSTGIWLSWPIGWIISAAMSVAFYCSGVWKRQLGKLI